MSITDVQMLFQFVGGLGMFLYGMNAMADGLQKSAGHRMQQLLGALTKNRLMGVILGAGITAIIQSSSATTVMVVGFVNAGIMNLGQAVGIIMGANIGTTVTSWIVSMSEWGEMLKPEFFAPALVGVGAIMTLFCKNSRKSRWERFWWASACCLSVSRLCRLPSPHTAMLRFLRRRLPYLEEIRFLAFWRELQ